jgi:iron complex outermembrane receptor protein
MTNVEKSYRIGMEISAGIKPVSFIDWSLNMTLSRNKISDFVEHYTDYNTTTREEEYKSRQHGSVDISYSPSLTGTSDLGLNIFRNTSLHFVSKYVGKQYFDNTMSDDRKLDPYLVNNIRFDFEPVISKIKRAEFQLLVNNIFNQKYVSNAYGGNWYEGGEEKTWAYYFPQAGINFMIRANFTF